MEKHTIGFGFWFTLVVLIFTALAVFAVFKSQTLSESAALNKTSRQVALSCTTDYETQFHIHPELAIVINGVRQTIPAEIGIQPTCMNAIHTHDDTGVIHIESPAKKDFAIGDFFAVWGKTFNKSQILDKIADDTSVITITVNGKAVDTYERTIMNDKDQIVITYAKK